MHTVIVGLLVILRLSSMILLIGLIGTQTHSWALSLFCSGVWLILEINAVHGRVVNKSVEGIISILNAHYEQHKGQ
jgi:hypothetical protein